MALDDAMFKDALGELLNMGLGQAADALSQMAREEVLLSLPQVEICDEAQVEAYARVQFPDDITAISQGFHGPLDGEGLLIFPDENSHSLVHALLNDQCGQELTELEFEALSEVGNIILNACLASFADTFGMELQTGLPRWFQGDNNTLMGQIKSRARQQFIMVQIDFTLKESRSQGYVMFILAASAYQSLRQRLGEMLFGLTG
ncbi:MAG: chemotaxis protein CheC [Bradymonadia bacterium]